MPQLPVIVFGAGGHGRVVAEVAAASGAQVLGFIDDGFPPGTAVLGFEVLGTGAWLASRPSTVVALGIGDNRRREAVAAELLAQGHTMPAFVHPSAVVSPTATLGEGTVVMARVVINAEARVGRGVILNTGCIVEHECHVGDFAHLSPASTLGGNASVGARTHIGIGATLLHQASVGRDCVVGGGAVVLKTVADGLTVVGVPAQPIRR